VVPTLAREVKPSGIRQSDVGLEVAGGGKIGPPWNPQSEMVTHSGCQGLWLKVRLLREYREARDN
jgi:hypothetical protein